MAGRKRHRSGSIRCPPDIKCWSRCAVMLRITDEGSARPANWRTPDKPLVERQGRWCIGARRRHPGPGGEVSVPGNHQSNFSGWALSHARIFLRDSSKSARNYPPPAGLKLTDPSTEGPRQHSFFHQIPVPLAPDRCHTGSAGTMMRSVAIFAFGSIDDVGRANRAQADRCTGKASASTSSVLQCSG